MFGLQRGVVGYAIQGDGTRVIEEKSSGDINCDGVRNCETRYTAKGQSYIYSSGDGSGQRVFMKKGNTKITIERSQGEAFSSSEWSDLIDAFEPIAADKLGYIFYFIDSKHVWRPV